MANPQIGFITREALCAHLPQKVQIRKGAKSGKYPLYLSVPWGSWFMHTPSGQDVLVSHGVITGAPVMEPDPLPTPVVEPDPLPASVVLIEDEPLRERGNPASEREEGPVDGRLAEEKSFLSRLWGE